MSDHLNSTLANFLFSKAIGCFSFIKTLPIVNPLALVCTLKGFSKFENYSIDVGDNFIFKRSNAFCCSPFHSNDPFFLKRSMNGLAKIEKVLFELPIEIGQCQ